MYLTEIFEIFIKFDCNYLFILRFGKFLDIIELNISVM